MGYVRDGCGIGKVPAVCIFGRCVGIGKARRRMYFWSEASPHKRWKSELRPVLLACFPVGDWRGVYLSVEIGVSGGKRAPVMPSVEKWELGVVPSVGERCVTRVYSSVEYRG